MFEDLRPHLVELRKRLAIAFGAVFLAFIVAFVYNETVLNWMVEPLENALTSNQIQSNLIEDGKITTHQVGGAFFVALKVSFFGGFIVALPIILWQIWLFIAPGLYDHEKKAGDPFCYRWNYHVFNRCCVCLLCCNPVWF